MCCFSGTSGRGGFRSVEKVSDTNIFGRGGTDGSQVLVDTMNLDTTVDLAMILPLPVPPGTSEDSVRFISLKGYAKFFQDMRRGFPPGIVPAATKGFRSLAMPTMPRLRV